MDLVNPAALEKYRFSKALRPFSFPVAIIACLVGIAAAYADGFWNPLSVSLILFAGVLLQAGVNLINDHADLPLLFGADPLLKLSRDRVGFNFKIGMLCFLIAAVIGFYLISITGLSLLLISVVGLLGALGYTVAPINYKNRGLGVVMVFWLMGVLMITGSYLAAGASFNWSIVWLSLPISCLVSLLLLSNELRDYERDINDGLSTLTVRLGYQSSVWLYWGLLFSALLISVALAMLGYLNHAWLLFFVLLLLPKPFRLLHAKASERKALTPATARILLGFGAVFCLLILL
ncbi:MAG: prenyltransferase [Oceanospirillales bacterium]|nr:MAG: prenyltransferase [Oceanospirillales bacterium]